MFAYSGAESVRIRGGLFQHDVVSDRFPLAEFSVIAGIEGAQDDIRNSQKILVTATSAPDLNF